MLWKDERGSAESFFKVYMLRMDSSHTVGNSVAAL